MNRPADFLSALSHYETGRLSLVVLRVVQAGFNLPLTAVRLRLAPVLRAARFLIIHSACLSLLHIPVVIRGAAVTGC